MQGAAAWDRHVRDLTCRLVLRVESAAQSRPQASHDQEHFALNCIATKLAALASLCPISSPSLPPSPNKQLLLVSLEAERQWRRSNWKYLPAGLLLAAGAFLAGAAWHQQASSAAAWAGAPSSSSGAGGGSSGSGSGSGSSGGWR